MTNRTPNIRFAFFGTVPLAAGVLEALARAGFVPERIVESADITSAFIAELAASTWDVFVVASFGKILPRAFLDIPRHGVLNVHPSLLPHLRGPSPIRSAILNDEKETGVSVMLLDEDLDHGPIVAQKKVPLPQWPPHGKELDALLAREGGALLARVLSEWIDGTIEARPQNHDLATYCDTFKKENGLIDLRDDAYHNLLKIRAFEGWPVAYTYFERAGKRLRVQLIDAHMSGNTLTIDRVKPEGKREMTYDEFLRSGAKPLATD